MGLGAARLSGARAPGRTADDSSRTCCRWGSTTQEQHRCCQGDGEPGDLHLPRSRLDYRHRAALQAMCACVEGAGLRFEMPGRRRVPGARCLLQAPSEQSHSSTLQRLHAPRCLLAQVAWRSATRTAGSGVMGMRDELAPLPGCQIYQLLLECVKDGIQGDRSVSEGSRGPVGALGAPVPAGSASRCRAGVYWVTV